LSSQLISSSFTLFSLTIRPPPTSTLFPYTTLFRSEVDAGLVAAHEPAPLAIEPAMVGIVLVVFLAWSEAGPATFRFVGRQYPGFAGGLAVGGDHQLAFGTGAVARHEIATIRLVSGLAVAL